MPDEQALYLFENGIAGDKLSSNDTYNDYEFTDDSEFDIDDDHLTDDGTYYDGFMTPQVSLASKRQLTEGGVPNLNYECLTTGDIIMNMRKRVGHLHSVLSLSEEDTLALMQHYDWNEERLLEAWTDNMSEILDTLGLKQHEKKTKDTTVRDIITIDNFSCPICCNDGTLETFKLECGHIFCRDCYKHYIKNKLHSGNLISCMVCSNTIKNEDIDKVMGYPVSHKLIDSSIKSFISKHNKHYKWCPYADCQFVLHLKDTASLPGYRRLHYSPFVECNNGHRFCFDCGFEIHAPADCIVTNAWVKKARKESENLNWVLSHTKECPECSVNIEKSGGCNHMVCGSCRYEFCWICEGAWAPHGKSFFQCTMYNSDENTSAKGKEESKKNLKRYTFYYRIFNEHEVSAKLDWRLGKTIGNKVKALQEEMGISWIEGQFLTESLKILNEGRTALKWSFTLAYYSDPSHNLTKIYIDNQARLSQTVEDLSELLKIKDPEIILRRKPEFYTKARYVENRTSAMLECGRDLLSQRICKITD